MRAKGFKKIYLKDTKRVLAPENNHKWVKVKPEDPYGTFLKRTEVLPSGTIVEYKGEMKNVFSKKFKPAADYITISKTVTKADGKEIVACNKGIFEYVDGIWKNLKDGSMSKVLFI